MENEMHGQWRVCAAEWDHDKWTWKPIKPALITMAWIIGWRRVKQEDDFQAATGRSGVTYTGD